MKPIANIIPDVESRVVSNFKNQVFALMVNNWSSIIGLQYLDSSFPHKISKYFNKQEEKYILTIAVANSALGMEISYMQGVILEKINNICGSECYFGKINTIVIPQGS